MVKKRICGRKVKRHQMTEKQLKASKKWCKSEISKINNELRNR